MQKEHFELFLRKSRAIKRGPCLKNWGRLSSKDFDSNM
jgi:hypothetical protein